MAHLIDEFVMADQTSAEAAPKLIQLGARTALRATLESPNATSIQRCNLVSVRDGTYYDRGIRDGHQLIFQK